MLSNDEMLRLQEISRVGEELDNFRNSGGFQSLKIHILDPMYQGAFEAFTRVDPSDSLQVVQTQQMGKVIKEIERLIESKIQEGRLARHTIAELPGNEGE